MPNSSKIRIEDASESRTPKERHSPFLKLPLTTNLPPLHHKLTIPPIILDLTPSNSKNLLNPVIESPKIAENNFGPNKIKHYNGLQYKQHKDAIRVREEA